AVLARDRGRSADERDRVGVPRPVALRLLQPLHLRRPAPAERQHADLRGLRRPDLRGDGSWRGRLGVRQPLLLPGARTPGAEQLGLPGLSLHAGRDRARTASVTGEQPWLIATRHSSGRSRRTTIGTSVPSSSTTTPTRWRPAWTSGPACGSWRRRAVPAS